MKESTAIKNIVFDLGNVFFGWSPEALYKQLIPDFKERDYFLNHICTKNWNAQLDKGRCWNEAIDELVRKHPDWEDMILAFDQRWEEMLTGEITGTTEILRTLKEQNCFRIFALTNWSQKKWAHALERYGHVLDLFDGIVVSGEEGEIKPEPALYRTLLNRYHIEAKQSFFTDDSLDNVVAAKNLGFDGEIFESPEKLALDLEARGIL